MNHFGTYLLTYKSSSIQVIFRRSHPTLKLVKEKMSEIIQVKVPIFFYFAKIQKMTKLGPKNRFWDLRIKINPSGRHPTLKLIKQKMYKIIHVNIPFFFILPKSKKSPS